MATMTESAVIAALRGESGREFGSVSLSLAAVSSESFWSVLRWEAGLSGFVRILAKNVARFSMDSLGLEGSEEFLDLQIEVRGNEPDLWALCQALYTSL